MSKKRVLSGIRTSGDIHLGIYMGAMTQWLERQNEDKYENWYFVADLHGITTPYDPKTLNELTWKTIMLYMACGLDVEKSTLFVQSHIPAHAELAWLLNCSTPFTWMKNMIQWKEKGGKIGEDSTVGLFDYPVLMAADILLYNTDLVPVGEDQLQHVEVAREIARRFNRLHKAEVFTEPEALLMKEVKRVGGLDDPNTKMSKSAESKYNYINLLDEPDEIRTKIAKAVTDDVGTIKFDPERKAINNLLTIYQFMTKEEKEEIEERYEGKGYADFKNDLGERIVEFLQPIQDKYKELDQNRDHVAEVLAHGAAQASLVANETLAKAKKKVGLLEPMSYMEMKTKPVVSFEDWLKLDVEIGTIIDVKDVENADKLYQIEIDFGDGTTTLVAGIKEYYKPDELKGQQIPILKNLAEKNIKNIKSKGMLLAVDSQGEAIILNPQKEAKSGDKVR